MAVPSLSSDGPAPMEAEPAQPAVEKKKKIIKKDVPVKAEGVAGYSQSQLNDLFEREHQMQSADKLQEDTNEAKNRLEEYIYSLRNKLYDTLAPYVKEVGVGSRWCSVWWCSVLFRCL